MPREGYLTPSSFADLMTNDRSGTGLGKSAIAVVNRLVMDLIGTERPEEISPISCAWGKENEWLAIEEYKERYMCDVAEAVFTVSTTHPYIGGIMDGLVGSHGGIEVKCPYNSSEHLANLIEGKQIKQYIYQMQGYMFIYDLDWIDFVSFDPRYQDAYALYVQRIPRDDDLITQIVTRCEVAYALAQDKVKMLGGLKIA